MTCQHNGVGGGAGKDEIQIQVLWISNFMLFSSRLCQARKAMHGVAEDQAEGRGKKQRDCVCPSFLTV